MSIAAKRLLSFVDKIIQTAMRSGDLPDQLSVRQALAKFARERSLDGPSLRYRAQPRRGQFKLDSYNSMVEEIVEDLNFAFAEQVDQANRLLKAVNESETRYKAFQHQVDVLEDLLEVLLLVEPKASGYFYSVGDQFRDLALIDQSNTTAGVDLASGIIHLPAAAGVRKIPMTHLADRTSILLKSDDEVPITHVGLIPGSKFGFAFDDTAQGWQHRVRSTYPDGWAGHITLPVAIRPMGLTDIGVGAARTEPQETHEIYISRIDVEGFSGTEMDVKILYSLDGRNYLNLPEHDWITLTGRRQSMLFERLKVEYLRVLMRKTTPDESVDQSHSYVVGFRNISLFDVGYASEGVLTSRELDPDLDMRIGRVVLEVNEHVPGGTEVDYYVAPYSPTPDWRGIQPANRAQAGVVPILDFTKSVLSPRRDNRAQVTSTPALNSARNGINFYNIMTLNGDQVPETAKLYRGIGGWQKEINTSNELITVRDNYVIFTRDDSFQKLYLEMEEEITSPPASVPSTPTTITVGRTIFSGDPSINVKPSGNPASQIPDYAIKQVMLMRSTAFSGAGTIMITEHTDGSRTVITSLNVTGTGFIMAGHYLHLVQGAVSGMYRILNVTEPTSGAFLYEIEDLNRDLTAGAVTYSVNTIDVTQNVLDINNNTFRIDSSVTVAVTDRLLVTYRSPLAWNEMPVSSSVVVKDSQGGSVFEAGRDYVFDPDIKGVSRRPDGRIAVTGDSRIVVRVDFQYTRTEHRLDTYTTWLKYDGDGAPIDFAALSVDHEAGEAVYLHTDGDRILDLSRVSKIDGLTPGWRRLTVLSKPIQDSTGAVDTATAIYKAINALDADGYPLFGDRLFSEKRAIKQPLRPVTLFYLQTSVGKDDRGNFALDGNNVVINWDPTDGKNTLYLAPGSLTVLLEEHFEVEYRYQSADTEEVTSLLFKAVLSRSKGCPADRTPVLYWYSLRLAH